MLMPYRQIIYRKDLLAVLVAYLAVALVELALLAGFEQELKRMDLPVELELIAAVVRTAAQQVPYRP